MSQNDSAPRQRLPRAERRAQLLQAARELIREQGSDALTLAVLAEHAGVSKPVTYQHFGTRSAVLAELYREFKARTHTALDVSLRSAPDSLPEVARIIAAAYIDCIDEEETELPGIVGALSGSTELEKARDAADTAFSTRCRTALEPFTRDGNLPPAALHAILGAADAIARAIVLEQITPAEGKVALAKTVAGVV
ncbi:TetR/AcrR family transcriptional regulator [Corynebacterium halotolerans]|uniref:TetR/AcrR family transcriptional regulator n=1 Tax=Corynebacterium halotolerans TaxID=225326 RepID=UPI003CEDD097